MMPPSRICFQNWQPRWNCLRRSDGRPVSYRVDSKGLGRELKEDETLSSAGVPDGDRLMITADITAG